MMLITEMINAMKANEKRLKGRLKMMNHIDKQNPEPCLQGFYKDLDIQAAYLMIMRHSKQIARQQKSEPKTYQSRMNSENITLSV